MRVIDDLAIRVIARIQAEEGQTMVEYGLILALVSVVAIAILTTLGTNIKTTFTSASNAL
jgi:pilus assembly protein Flp/PilA